MHFEHGQTVGIDLGTTFSAIAQLNEEGTPVALPNEDDELETASLILLAANGRVIVGPNRARAAMEDPDRVVERIKRHMGCGDYQRTFDGRPITPEFLSALILKKLCQDAAKRIGKIGNAVITVPYYFNDVRRKATQDAGRIAGLNVIDIINEPTAATLTYAWHRGELGTPELEGGKPRKVLVYDLGGGTFDVTVVRYTPTQLRVLATDGDVELGGIDWTQRLVDHVAEEFKARHGTDPRQSPATLQVLRNDCEVAKIQLSRQLETIISCRHAGRAITVSVTREQFDFMTADLLQRTADTTELVLEQAGITSEELDALVMVGGSTLMPQVPKMIQKLTGCKPYEGLSPHTGVAQGAAIHAAILEAKHRGQQGRQPIGTRSESPSPPSVGHAGAPLNGRAGGAFPSPADLTVAKVRKMLRLIKQENVNSHGLGIVVTDPWSGKRVNHVMIPRNTRLPTEVRRVFRTNHHGQQRVSVRITEGDAPDPAACSRLGKFCITDLPPDLPKGSKIEVTYAFDQSGRITVKAREVTGGKEASIEIQHSGWLDEQQVDAYRKLASEYKVE